MGTNKITAYSEERQNKYFVLEDESWWFVFRAKIFTFLAHKYMRFDREVYDIGGSNGFNSLRIQEAGYSITLIEPTQIACENAKSRGVTKVINLPFQEYDGEIEQFLCLDVIEHIKDDKHFICDLYLKCCNGAIGIISVPAFMSLWSSEDEADGHFRRYTEKELVSALEEAGFTVLFSNYLFKWLYMPIYFRRHLLEKVHLVHTVHERSVEEEEYITNRQFLNPKGLLGRIVDALLDLEYRKIVAERRISYGSSLVCVVEKCL